MWFEGWPLGGWLARELYLHVDKLIVCEPHRNNWREKDGDKGDPIDARKLAELFRGGYVMPGHQTGSQERLLLKQLVLLYHDRVLSVFGREISWSLCVVGMACLSGGLAAGRRGMAKVPVSSAGRLAVAKWFGLCARVCRVDNITDSWRGYR